MKSIIATLLCYIVRVSAACTLGFTTTTENLGLSAEDLVGKLGDFDEKMMMRG